MSFEDSPGHLKSNSLPNIQSTVEFIYSDFSTRHKQSTHPISLTSYLGCVGGVEMLKSVMLFFLFIPYPIISRTSSYFVWPAGNGEW